MNLPVRLLYDEIIICSGLMRGCRYFMNNLGEWNDFTFDDRGVLRMLLSLFVYIQILFPGVCHSTIVVVKLRILWIRVDLNWANDWIERSLRNYSRKHTRVTAARFLSSGLICWILSPCNSRYKSVALAASCRFKLSNNLYIWI